MKIYTLFLTLIVFWSSLASPVFAHGDIEDGDEDLVTQANVDVNVEDVGILPNSPIYFLKEWARGIRAFFTFNAVSRAEYRLRVVNEKAAEARKVAELYPNDTEALNRAIENYRTAQERLQTRFEELRETSENPNIDRLVSEMNERTARHEALFEELISRRATSSVPSSVQPERPEVLESERPSANPSSARVIINASGNFSPKTVTVKKGGIVTWVNQSPFEIWPASAPHPVHTNYPGFDAQKGIANGETYSFTFDKTGTWNYHNHLNVASTGVVEVVE